MGSVKILHWDSFQEDQDTMGSSDLEGVKNDWFLQVYPDFKPI